MERAMKQRVAFIGFGEVGGMFSQAVMDNGHEITAYDLKFDDAESVPSRNAIKLGVPNCQNAGQAVGEADIVFSAVTANRTLDAALSVRDFLKPDAWFFDLNSAAPDTKCNAARIIDGAGGRYVEAAIMSPIQPDGTASPIILAGPNAREFEPVAHDIGFLNAAFYSSKAGKAAAAKLCRSVIVKGMESLLTESLLAARAYGVEEYVLSSLEKQFPHTNWEKRAQYMISRAVMHGTRRAEEMLEAAHTLQNAGCSPIMSNACADRQKLSAAFPEFSDETNLHALLDALLKNANEERPL